MKHCNKCHETKPVGAFGQCTRDGYQSRCKACTNAVSGAWNKANRERVNAASRSRRAADPAKHLEKEREIRAANPEAARARHRKWRDKNAEMERQRSRDWAAANKPAMVAKQHARRARKAGNGGRFTVNQAEELKASYLGKCAYCLSAAAEHLDHVVPIADGGTSNIENMVPACARCNLSKNKRSLLRFMMIRKAA